MISVKFKGADEALTTPLAMNLQPLHVYSIDITVNSAKIKIDVSSTSWDEASSDATIADPEESWSIVINKPGWIVKEEIEDGQDKKYICGSWYSGGIGVHGNDRTFMRYLFVHGNVDPA